MSKSIHTIDSRENLELLTVAAFFGIQSDAMHSLISDWHDLLEAELQSEGIDYRELKAALVPAKKKREAALIFDTAAIPDAWYLLPVFEKLLQYLDRKSVNSVLMGDFIERSSPGYLQRCLEETGSRIDTDGTHDHFIVYLNRWVLSIPFFISCIRQQNPLTVLSKIILRKVKQFNLPPKKNEGFLHF